ncbi:MAG: type II toxin-antitoxin system VapC family toxin [Gammaproteobacteria bacterium]|nr:type II toxin-antitoxin system VapC family toxin [Gammaproteobacteria bacterium]
MTRYLCDTNCLIASVCDWHEHHARTHAEVQRRNRAGQQLVLATHSLAEIYAVLTRLPPPRRMRGQDALTLIEGNWSDTPATHLTARETWDALRSAQLRNVRGGQMYDALIATAALKARSSAILTWNHRNFEPFAGDIRIESPP